MKADGRGLGKRSRPAGSVTVHKKYFGPVRKLDVGPARPGKKNKPPPQSSTRRCCSCASWPAPCQTTPYSIAHREAIPPRFRRQGDPATAVADSIVENMAVSRYFWPAVRRPVRRTHWPGGTRGQPDPFSGGGRRPRRRSSVKGNLRFPSLPRRRIPVSARQRLEVLGDVLPRPPGKGLHSARGVVAA